MRPVIIDRIPDPSRYRLAMAEKELWTLGESGRSLGLIYFYQLLNFSPSHTQLFRLGRCEWALAKLARDEVRYRELTS